MMNFGRLFKRCINTLFKKDFFARLDFRIPTQRIGSSYGGWNIVPKFISLDSTIYSFGIGNDASFDLALISQFKVVIYAFDPTPQSASWVEDQCFPKNFVFHKTAIAGFDGVALFYPPENPHHISHSMIARPICTQDAIQVPTKRLRTIMDELGHSKIDVLKMDVEGSEYTVIDDMINSDIFPKQLLIEFHHRFPNIGVEMTRNAISKIRRRGYGLAFVSETGEEFLFIKK